MTDNKVIPDGQSVLMARDRAMEHWLQTQVGLAHDALKANPSRAVPITQVRKKLAAIHRTATAKSL